MVFADVWRASHHLVIADSAWHVDHYLHQNPELKRFAFAWLIEKAPVKRERGDQTRLGSM